ncbi:bis(5'-nucleosyl)-tetraphosphatase PrpE [asymmetrical]-like [Mytilus galloprovincialis]|uniref:bis(5'-nucleosyl)-tetraphosphatase PrpE [asymmetrical]-like n=1 Tax=Mytilus galloprovincialis TaxID=29158 RepID=UPI003F7B41DC
MYSASMTSLLIIITSLLRTRKPISTVRRFTKYKLPLPKSLHLTLENSFIQGRDIFIIGDVHGCLDELEELLELAKLEIKEKKMLPIFVGDLANKGPRNLMTIRKVRQMDALAVRGNHEEAIIQHYLNLQNDLNYVIPEVFKWITELNTDDITYLLELPYTISIPWRNILIVHAGLVPGIPIHQQNLDNFIHIRNLYQDNDGNLLASELPFQGEAWASLWSGPEHVYFGHDASRKLQQHPYATGLDTGCLYGNMLSGIFINSKKMLQVKAKKVYSEPKGFKTPK